MGMTMTQKILAAHAGLPEVSAGQLIEADLDLVLGNDITSPVAIKEMDAKMTKKSVFDKDKIALYGIHGRYLEYRVYLGRYSEDGGEIISYLYLPEVKFNEEDFVHIENLEGDWYYAIYNYQPIKRKHTE